MTPKLNLLFYLLSFSILILSCDSDDDNGQGPPGDDGDLTMIDFQPKEMDITIPEGYPLLEQPEDNKMTIDGVLLGRHLFFDPILSADETMSCGSCHLQEGSFTDNLPVSEGIDGIAGNRSSMPLINLAYNFKGLFWDGRVNSLEEQALLPVEDPIELHNNWDDLVEKLKAHDSYPEKFRKAFGITNKSQITKELAVKAIAQFERTLVTSGNSEFDKVFHQNIGFFSDEANNGFAIFFDTSPDLPDGECSHCHSEPFFTDDDFRNNGLDFAETLDDFKDNGRGDVTGNPFDNGKFRTPTLWNWEFSAPYMHDGRFETIEEVLDHYISGGQWSPNKDPLIIPHDDPSVPEFYINDEHRADLLAFLKTLRDTTLLNNERYSNPFN